MKNQRLLFFIMTFLFMSTLYSQVSFLDVSVKFDDGIVPFSILILSNDSLKTKTKGLTDLHGFYRFNNLPPGKYSIKVQSTGLNDTAMFIDLIGKDSLRLDINLNKCSAQYTLLSCPICHKSDQVIRVGSDGIIRFREPWSTHEENGKCSRKTTKLGYQTYYYEGQELLHFKIDENKKKQYSEATLCERLLFCKRDKIVYKTNAP